MKYPLPMVWMKEVCIEVGGWIECWFEEHKLVRRLLVIWAVWLITVVVLTAVEKMTVIDTPTAALIATIVGILATVTAFYIRSRELDEKRKDDVVNNS